MMEGDDSSSFTLQTEEGCSSSKRPKMDGWDSDRLLNFATAADEYELNLKRQKIPRDPMSHRIIEKRRRDRMNNCLADLSRLIPASYHKQGQGRIEKTEIIEMAIKHINLLQNRVNDLEKKVSSQERDQVSAATAYPSARLSSMTPTTLPNQDSASSKFYMGFREAQDEVMRFLVEVESVNTTDPFCRRIMGHLENASLKFLKDHKTDMARMDLESQPLPFSQANYEAANVLGSLHQDTDHKQSAVPAFSYSSHLSTSLASNLTGAASSGYVSDMSNMDKPSPNGSTSSRDNVYKFKHNITKRFSQEGHHSHRYSHHHHQRTQNHLTSDTSSNTSSRDLDEDQGHLRWKSKNDPTATDNCVNTSDECRSISNGASTDTGCGQHLSSKKADGSLPKITTDKLINPPLVPQQSGSSIALPGFILHPTGTHYMPISVHNTNMTKLFESAGDEGVPVFHPISIPVHFRRPIISMPHTTICAHNSSQFKNRQPQPESS